MLMLHDPVRPKLLCLFFSSLLYIQAYPTVPREKWILQWPGQVVIAGGQMYWTRSVTEAITKGGTYGLQQLEAQNTKELMEEVCEGCVSHSGPGMNAFARLAEPYKAR
jgi:hypothetical protein